MIIKRRDCFLKLMVIGFMMGPLPTQAASATGNWVLEKVVTLSRHGVRPQTNIEKLNKATGRQWPAFHVADGHLTGHGYTGVWQQAGYQLQQWQHDGFHMAWYNQCPQSNQVFLWTGPSQRIKATGKALADGMFPGCGIVPHAVNAKYGPLFELYHLHLSHPDKKIMKQQIMERMGSPEQAAKRYQKDVALLRKTVCAPGSCQFLDKPWGVSFKSTGKPKLNGPVSVGATIGETIRLQYSDNLPSKDVAFGYGGNAKVVKSLMALHAAQYNLALDTPEFAAHNGSLLMRQILAAITSGTPLHKHWPGDKRLNRPLVMLVGHDTNIAEIQTMLGFHWTLPGYPSNDIPPGSSLNLARFHNQATGKDYIRVRFSARSLDQWRKLIRLNAQHPLLYQDLSFNGCTETKVGTLCPFNQVVTKASHLLTDDGINIPVFQG